MPSDDPQARIDAVQALVAAAAPDSRRLRRLIALLTEEPRDLGALIQCTGLPRRSVEEVLAALGGDLARSGPSLSIRQDRHGLYRSRFGYEQLARTELADPLAARLAGAADVVTAMTELIGSAPRARADLDHVPATPVTSVRRALWLDSTYDMAGAVLLCVGDHDLTSLAVAQISPEAEIIVVDVDEATLEFIDAAAGRIREHRAGRLGGRVRCLAGDLRFGLPEQASGLADLVFTDPPYTPEGVGLFAARGLQGLRDQGGSAGRVIVAYGYSERHPALGVQVQSVAHHLGLACEAVLPRFSTYAGAEAVGSSSALYVWRPTSRTWRGLDRFVSDRVAGIYTRGPQSVEAGPGGASSAGKAGRPPFDSVPDAVLRVTSEAGFPVTVLVSGLGGGWRDAGPAITRLRLGTLLSKGMPAGAQTRHAPRNGIGNSARDGVGDAARDGVGDMARDAALPLSSSREASQSSVVADLSADPGQWLLRVLLAVQADRAAVIVPNNHPDLASEAGQRSLASLIGPKYTLRFLRGQPDSGHAIVVATVVESGKARADRQAGADGEAGIRLVRRILSRAHGKLGNVWREGLIEASRQESGPESGGALTKRAAQAIIEAGVETGGEAGVSGRKVLETRLIDLPRHQLVRVLQAAKASVDTPHSPAPSISPFA
jgi:predicted methyltransferase